MRGLRRRLDHLGRLCPSPGAHLYLACVDASGRVLDDGTDAVGPWVGRHSAELPGPVQFVVGIDPLRALGRAGGGSA